MLSFTVVNHTDHVQEFCKWETPFETRLGKYLEILHDKGTEAQFHGAMARRVMPPPPEAYIKVPAHYSVHTVINLAKNYSFNAGVYKISYTGSDFSGLDVSKASAITVDTR